MKDHGSWTKFLGLSAHPCWAGKSPVQNESGSASMTRVVQLDDILFRAEVRVALLRREITCPRQNVTRYLMLSQRACHDHSCTCAR
jgi:hypothetical protein